jgi:hypothetical protein
MSTVFSVAFRWVGLPTAGPTDQDTDVQEQAMPCGAPDHVQVQCELEGLSGDRVENPNAPI